MGQSLDILIDRLASGKILKINEIFDSEILDVDEKELQFPGPVKVAGEAYLSEDQLIIRLSASTIAQMPCAICNKMATMPIQVTNLYHAEPTQEIKGAIFSYHDLLREAILLEIPHTFECSKGRCPDRPLITPYLRGKTKEGSDKESTHFPFADLS
ncbi:MAG: hypothetical protein RL235_186 [Chlamydiota bacterium]|jgi:uncharacterized metal-binding protein YceD (DUF177 family)